MTFVVIGILFFGSSSIIDKSISPIYVIESVLGIGVAVIDKKWGFIPFSVSLLRCPTPNRCCSSIITSPRFLKFTSSWIIA